MGSWFYAAKFYFEDGRCVLLSGIVQALGCIAAYKDAQFEVEKKLLKLGAKIEEEIAFEQFNKV